MRNTMWWLSLAGGFVLVAACSSPRPSAPAASSQLTPAQPVIATPPPAIAAVPQPPAPATQPPAAATRPPANQTLEQPTSPPTDRSNPPTAVPTPGRTVWVANTGGTGVYVRKTPSLNDRLRAYADGSPLLLAGEADGDGVHWFHVVTADGVEGYVPAEYVADHQPPARLVPPAAPGQPPTSAEPARGQPPQNTPVEPPQPITRVVATNTPARGGGARADATVVAPLVVQPAFPDLRTPIVTIGPTLVAPVQPAQPAPTPRLVTPPQPAASPAPATVVRPPQPAATPTLVGPSQPAATPTLVRPPQPAATPTRGVRP